MNKNGKYIKCKTCGKEFYISASRFNIKKYCSFECSKKDNFGFKQINKKCVICGENFIISSGMKANKKTCSNECHYELAKQISKKSGERIVEYKCKECGKIFNEKKQLHRKFCSTSCQIKHLKTNRTGKNNPNYKIGLYIGRNRLKRSKTETKHLYNCSKYKNEFVKKNGYKFCEICGVNENGTMQFQTHHIYSASKKPKHKELHNPKNLILLCLECHQKFHSSKYKDKFLELEKDRGLKELFK